MIINEISVADLKLLLKDTEKALDTPSREVLKQIDICVFWGGRVWAGQDTSGSLLSFNVTRFGKKKISVWEPYANWYLSFTVPAHRLQGHAKTLALHTRGLAQVAGCSRIKSLAGSWAGARLHASVNDDFWGITVKGELAVDTPLDRTKAYPSDQLPKGVRTALRDGQAFGEPMSLDNIKILTGEALCYDR